MHNKAAPDTTESCKLYLPFAFAKRHGICVMGYKNSPKPKAIFKLGINPGIIQETQRFLETEFELSGLAPKEFDSQLATLYQKASESTEAEIETMGGINLDSIADSISETDDLLEQNENAPIVKLINALLIKAIEEKASDIHIETFEKHMVVRFRIDGVLQEIIRPKRGIAAMLVSRIKIMSNLDIAEKRLPQDGHIALKIAGRGIDLRVSTIPASAGERVVLRILDKDAGSVDLQEIGMSAEHLDAIQKLISRPHGVILVTGPTGSGKTTTLYASLLRLNHGQLNIMTVEDPIEYMLEGIGQTQVNRKVDMTFAQGLRAILRQDPDVVMVGEIRDQETAKIAIRASLTGHLVFSTLHTNSAIGAISRLRDMGIESYMLSSGIIGLIAQRLVRTLCTHCREPHVADKETCLFLGVNPDNPPQLFKAVGCDKCRKTGYRGRTGIYEIIDIDDQLRQLIHDNASEQTLEKYARQHSKGMLEESCAKVLAGITGADEVKRIILED